VLDLPHQIFENICPKKSIASQEFVAKFETIHLSVVMIAMSFKELTDTLLLVSLTGSFFLLTFVFFHVWLYFTIVAAF